MHHWACLVQAGVDWSPLRLPVNQSICMGTALQTANHKSETPPAALCAVYACADSLFTDILRKKHSGLVPALLKSLLCWDLLWITCTSHLIRKSIKQNSLNWKKNSNLVSRTTHEREECVFPRTWIIQDFGFLSTFTICWGFKTNWFWWHGASNLEPCCMIKSVLSVEKDARKWWQGPLVAINWFPGSDGSMAFSDVKRNVQIRKKDKITFEVLKSSCLFKNVKFAVCTETRIQWHPLNSSQHGFELCSLFSAMKCSFFEICANCASFWKKPFRIRPGPLYHGKRMGLKWTARRPSCQRLCEERPWLSNPKQRLATSTFNISSCLGDLIVTTKQIPDCIAGFVLAGIVQLQSYGTKENRFQKEKN